MVITELVCGLLQSDNFVRCLYLFSAMKLWISKMLGNNFHFAFYLLLLFFSHNVMSDSLKLHGLQHARLLCPPLLPRVGGNSCPLSRWCYLTISSSASPFLLLPSTFPSIREIVTIYLLTKSMYELMEIQSLYIKWKIKL